ncbi:MAG TPA: 50S ribosomal protein L31 [Thermotogota bacterium]|jgi:large subunit ribosomal protein L31|nr:50S ribosomal protein L31 [Thermotogota bacterium]NLZ14331.1 50S ribosomal protein L31 [Thermotogaceae bacterium]MDD8040044.1 50S ribosomal protein L31 [Thermotogota bacterium]MDD8052457.1 50S ribosomal protein L31 [Thermotogota bacterium]HNR63823.1 50S ribosomal protein L31 [Thermotogota bacterium]
MKEKIHPVMNHVTAQCACGARFDILTTSENVKLDVCSRCHPFFQGKGDSLIIDTEGRIDKFKKRFGDKIGGAGTK